MNETFLYLSSSKSAFEKRMLIWSNSRSKRLGFFAVLWCFSMFFYFPDYQDIFAEGAQEGLEARISHPLTPNESANDTHTAKTEFRLFIPVLGKLLGLNGVQLALLIQGLAFCFFLCSFDLFRRLTKDRLAALLLTCGLTFSYFAKAFNASLFHDAYGLLLLVIAACLQKGWWQLPVLFCAGFTDERAIFAILIFPLLNTYLSKKEDSEGVSLEGINLLSKAFYLPVISVVLIVLTRLLLGKFFGLYTPIGADSGIGIITVIQNFKWFPLATLSALEGYWILFLLGILFLVRTRKYLQSLLILTYVACLMGIAFSVIDVTRSLSYLVMIPFTMAVFIGDLKLGTKRDICLIVLLFNLIIPNYYIFGGPDDFSFWLTPMFPKIFKIIPVLI